MKRTLFFSFDIIQLIKRTVFVTFDIIQLIKRTVFVPLDIIQPIKRTVFVLTTLLIFAVKLDSQPRFGDERGNISYRTNEMLMNPALTGAQDSISIVALSARLQWLDVEGAPISQNIQFQTATLAPRSGLGVSIHNDSYGLNRNLQFALHYSYKLHLRHGSLSFGLNLAALTCGTEAITDLDQQSDPQFARPSVRSWGFNAGAGAYYRAGELFAGLSIPQLFANDFTPDQRLSNTFAIDRLQYILVGGYRFRPHPLLNLQPTLLLALSQRATLGYELMLAATYRSRLEIGLGHSAGNHLQLAAGIALLRKLSLRYQYGQSLGHLSNNFSGIHNISLAMVIR